VLDGPPIEQFNRAGPAKRRESGPLAWKAFMAQVLIVIHLLIVLALVGVILMQRSEGGALGGLGGGGGVSGFLTGRGQANVLTRATAILAAAFFATSIVLAIVGGVHRAPKSILDTAVPSAGGPAAPAAPGAPAPAGGSVLDQLKQLEQQRSSEPTAPQVPATR
jgi:preprotein translocase subunit SecG